MHQYQTKLPHPFDLMCELLAPDDIIGIVTGTASCPRPL